MHDGGGAGAMADGVAPMAVPAVVRRSTVETATALGSRHREFIRRETPPNIFRTDVLSTMHLPNFSDFFFSIPCVYTAKSSLLAEFQLELLSMEITVTHNVVRC